MGKVLPALTDGLRAFIDRQRLFFVATAPLAGGHVNLSPKGMDSFRVLGPSTVGYVDSVGSGNETSAHVLQNGRITFMFCAFEGSPLILRLYGRGRPVLPQDADWSEHARHFELLPGTRQIFAIHVDQVQTSCGWGVPYMTLERERDTLSKYHRQHGEDVRQAKYAVRLKSIDGLPVRNPTCEPRQGERHMQEQQQQ